jgi:putative hemin transport protein
MSKHIIARPALRRTSLAVLLVTTLAAAGCATQPSLSERWQSCSGRS